jgi:Ca2+-transporting ATPase
LNWVVSGAVIFLVLVLTVPFLRNLFTFDALNLWEVALALGGAVLSVVWFEIYKVLKYRR